MMTPVDSDSCIDDEEDFEHEARRREEALWHTLENILVPSVEYLEAALFRVFDPSGRGG